MKETGVKKILNKNRRCNIVTILFTLCAFFNPLTTQADIWEKISYNLQPSPIDVVFMCHPKDQRTLDLAIDGIKQYGQNIHRIIVVSPATLTQKAEWFDEQNYPFSKEDIAREIIGNDPVALQAYLNNPTNRLNWIYQQLLKLYAPFVIPTISANVLMVDSDTVFLRDTTFMDEDGNGFFNPGYEHNQSYFDFAQRLLPGFKKVYPEYSGISHHMLLQKPILEDLFATITKIHGVEPWKAISRCINIKDFCPMSEFELYFNFALSKTDQVTIRKLMWANIKFDEQEIENHQNRNFNYVSCHAFYDAHPHLVAINNDPRMHVSDDTQRKDHAIVFIHLGDKLPAYLPEALTQARLFNSCPIYLLANTRALNQYTFNQALTITTVPVESLTKSDKHDTFIKQSQLDRHFRDGIFFYSSERFFYLEDFMEQYHKKNVFQLETDVMLYANLTELMPTLLANYPGMAITMDNDERCIPGFIFINDPKSLQPLTSCFLQHQNANDMQTLVLFKKAHSKIIVDTLPIITKHYTANYPLQTKLGQCTQDATWYTQHANTFNSIFDAAALGQYLGGTDPKNENAGPGFVNERCLFNPSRMQFIWIFDNQQRKVPYMVCGNQTYRINNLHIHSKNLAPFSSLSKEIPHA